LELALCPAAELARGEVPAVLFEWILASDAAVALEVIDAGELPGQVVLEQLATGPVRSRIHRLVLGDHRQVVGELALLGGQLPALRALEVRGPGIELMGFVHPQLEQLRLVCRGDWSGVLTTAGVQLPALSRLELRFDQRHLDAYWGPPGQGPPPEAIAGLLDRDALPALRTLSLSRLVCDAHLLDALIAAPAFASLRCLALTDVGCLVDVFAELGLVLGEVLEGLGELGIVGLGIAIDRDVGLVDVGDGPAIVFSAGSQEREQDGRNDGLEEHGRKITARSAGEDPRSWRPGDDPP
ncbi:MAG: hypothetical protein KC457_29805, partial [Myxococcales bacterium]|nr:hypothetical protein [Myxococcales bacterium]